MAQATQENTLTHLQIARILNTRWIELTESESLPKADLQDLDARKNELVMIATLLGANIWEDFVNLDENNKLDIPESEVSE
jgi:hypothetical protein